MDGKNYLFNIDENLNDNKFLLLECGADGNCLFHVIAEALNNHLICYNKGDFEDIKLYDVESLRELSAMY